MPREVNEQESNHDIILVHVIVEVHLPNGDLEGESVMAGKGDSAVRSDRDGSTEKAPQIHYHVSGENIQEIHYTELAANSRWYDFLIRPGVKVEDG